VAFVHTVPPLPKGTWSRGRLKGLYAQTLPVLERRGCAQIVLACNLFGFNLISIRNGPFVTRRCEFVDPGRPLESRAALAPALPTKAVFDGPETRALVERLGPTRCCAACAAGAGRGRAEQGDILASVRLWSVSTGGSTTSSAGGT